MRYWIIIFFSCILFFAKGQNDTIAWQNLASFPSTPRIDYASFVIDSNYYIIGGLDSGYNFYSEVWRYNVPSNTWQKMKSFPGGPISEPVGFTINEKGYITCGNDSASMYSWDNEFWEYYPSVDTWQHKANYPGAPREVPVRFVYGKYAFVGMGAGVGANDLWRYNSISDSWDSVSDIPTGLREGCGISVIDSFTFILGGDNRITELDDIWRYNMNQDRWDSIGVIPGGLRDGPLFWTFDSIILIGYGFIQDTIGTTVGDVMEQDSLYSYNTRTNRWDTISCVNFPDSIADDGSGCFLLGKTAYFFGGFKTEFPNFLYYNNLWSFDASRFFQPDTPNGIADIKNQAKFSVYPNPIKSDQQLSISSSEGGEIFFYDEIGRLLDDRKINQGLNQIKLITNNEVVFYRATLQCGETENGKIVILK